MKRFLKWIAIGLGFILLLIIAFVLYIMVSHDMYGRYASGGVLSEAQAAYDVIFYDLNLEVLSEDQALSGYVTITIRSMINGLETVELDLIDNFDVSQVITARQNELGFKHDEDKLVIHLTEELDSNQTVDLSIYYEGRPVEALYSPWLGGFNWSEDSTGADWIGVACQAEGAKIWFPCKDHPSDEPDSAAINITIPDGYLCVSNGLLRRTTIPRAGFKTYHWFTHYPINNYNINISIGRYREVSVSYRSEAGQEMPVSYYVLPESQFGADSLLAMAVEMLTIYRKYFGEYPFITEKFGLVQTDYMGMEHQTINAYGNRYRYRTFHDVTFDELMLHEMGHEWWGNKVTAADWADMWIQEGICTYGEALFIREKAGEEGYHSYMRRKQGFVLNTDPVIPKRNATSQEVYQRDIYYKGASLMHSLRFILGDSVFFNSLYKFATDSAYIFHNLVSTDDFISLFNGNPDNDYSEYIKMMLYTTELPHVVVDSVANNTYQIFINNISFHLPMAITLDDSVKRFELGREMIEVVSAIWPVVDERGWYLKRVSNKKMSK